MIERIDVMEMFIVIYKMGIYKETENIYACQTRFFGINRPIQGGVTLTHQR